VREASVEAGKWEIISRRGDIGLAGTRQSRVRWRHSGRGVVRWRREAALGGSVARLLRRYEGALYVAECAAQTAGYAALTLGAAWLLWRFVP
jgi:hypothetical protein